MPLPLRDYYPITRAAELLGCTIDDLLHWAMTGCIRVYIKVEHSHGVLLEESLSDVVGCRDFNVIVDGTEYKDKLFAIDELDDEWDGEYFLERARVIYDAMNHYIRKHSDIKCLNEIGLREDFAHLRYFFSHDVTEDFCAITSEEWFRQGIGDKDDKYQDEISKIPSLSKPFIVSMRGFFGLGGGFFEGFNFHNKFSVDQCGDGNNLVYMPESDLCISMISNVDVRFEIEDLFIFKCDFLEMQKSSINGDELKKKYSYQRISNNHGWWRWLYHGDEEIADSHKVEKTERVSRPAINALNILISKYHNEIKNSPTKLAEVLTAEAIELGIENVEFDKNTVSRWINGRINKP